MVPTITTEIVVAYAQCPRKAFLLLFSSDKGEPHEYVQILQQQRCKNQERFLDCLRQTHTDIHPYSPEHLQKGSDVLINARLQVGGLEGECGVLTRIEGKSTFDKHYYEPTVFVGTTALAPSRNWHCPLSGMCWGGSRTNRLWLAELLGWTAKRIGQSFQRHPSAACTPTRMDHG
jgi:hypothetical protein